MGKAHGILFQLRCSAQIWSHRYVLLAQKHEFVVCYSNDLIFTYINDSHSYHSDIGNTHWFIHYYLLSYTVWRCKLRPRVTASCVVKQSASVNNVTYIQLNVLHKETSGNCAQNCAQWNGVTCTSNGTNLMKYLSIFIKIYSKRFVNETKNSNKWRKPWVSYIRIKQKRLYQSFIKLRCQYLKGIKNKEIN